MHNCGIPDQAGLVDLKLILQEPRLSEFQNQQRWRDDSKIFDLPKPCYMVKPEDEHAYQSKMLGSRMAGLIPELEVPRRGDGSLLLEGQFNVAGSKPEGKKRLIFDARPSNEREELQDRLELSVGFMLKSMVLRPGHGVRGSGFDLTTMVSQLREYKSAWPQDRSGRRVYFDLVKLHRGDISILFFCFRGTAVVPGTGFVGMLL